MEEDLVQATAEPSATDGSVTVPLSQWNALVQFATALSEMAWHPVDGVDEDDVEMLAKQNCIWVTEIDGYSKLAAWVTADPSHSGTESVA